jgi:non-heme chloroperoxidase
LRPVATAAPAISARANRELATKNPDPGPLPIIDREKTTRSRWAIANASFKSKRRNEGVTENKKISNRGHSLTIDSGWREVAETALAFVKCFLGRTRSCQAKPRNEARVRTSSG